ncbi:type VI secretion system tube protein Hcp [Caulobacter sp.]|uniref:type VI secretion system tube protein Hcp n=1 Tax=Caulobacter sp. TaxID=78 RepID=UPI003BAF5FFC
MDLILLRPGDASLFQGLDMGVDLGKIDGLPDGPDAPDPSRCLKLISIGQGLKQQMTTDVSNMARTSGRPIITEIACVKAIDAASVRLYDACMRVKSLGAGERQPTFIYVLRSSGDKYAVVQTIALRDALVSEIEFQSHPDDMPTERFKLNFTEILWTYVVQTAGATTGQVSAGWSLARNRPIGAFTA